MKKLIFISLSEYRQNNKKLKKNFNEGFVFNVLYNNAIRFFENIIFFEISFNMLLFIAFIILIYYYLLQ